MTAPEKPVIEEPVIGDPVIDTLEPSEARRAAKLIAAAFRDDPAMTWAFNGPSAIEPANRILARKIYLKDGFGHQMRDDSAGTLWLRPGARPELDLAAQFALPFAILRHGGFTALQRAAAMGEALMRGKPKEPHYYLYTISVRPDRQGKGLGRRILTHALDGIDREGMAAYLENSKARNTPFYRSLGFEVIEEIVPVPGCPPMWTMWRPAR